MFKRLCEKVCTIYSSALVLYDKYETDSKQVPKKIIYALYTMCELALLLHTCTGLFGGFLFYTMWYTITEQGLSIN